MSSIVMFNPYEPSWC